MKKTHICSRCRRELQSHNFYKDSNKTSGLRSACKECEFDSVKKKNKRYYSTNAGKISMKKGRESFNRKFPEKHIAHRELYNSIRRGETIKPSVCSLCNDNSSIIHGHHKDYNSPLDVIWCCTQCHVNIHKELKNAK